MSPINSTVLELYSMEIPLKISMPNCQKLNTMVKRNHSLKLRFRNFDALSGKLRQEQWLRVAGEKVALREEQEFANSGKQKVSVREETSAVSDTRVMIVQNRHQKQLHPLIHQHQEAGVRREQGASEAEASLGSPTDSRAKTSWKVLALNYLVTIGILPNVSFRSAKRDVNSPHWKVEEEPNKRPKKGGDKKCSSYCEKCATVGLRVTRR